MKPGVETLPHFYKGSYKGLEVRSTATAGQKSANAEGLDSTMIRVLLALLAFTRAGYFKSVLPLGVFRQRGLFSLHPDQASTAPTAPGRPSYI